MNATIVVTHITTFNWNTVVRKRIRKLRLVVSKIAKQEIKLDISWKSFSWRERERERRICKITSTGIFIQLRIYTK